MKLRVRGTIAVFFDEVDVEQVNLSGKKLHKELHRQAILRGEKIWPKVIIKETIVSPGEGCTVVLETVNPPYFFKPIKDGVEL